MKIIQQVLWKGKKMKVTKLTIHKDQYMKFPIILQACVEWRNEAGELCDTWVDGNELEFIND